MKFHRSITYDQSLFGDESEAGPAQYGSSGPRVDFQFIADIIFEAYAQLHCAHFNTQGRPTQRIKEKPAESSP